MVAMVALLMGGAILLFSCKEKAVETEESLDAIKTEESHDLTIIMSENGRKSYIFTTPLLEGYTLGRDPYREFRKGISITTYQDDSLTTENAVLVANYAIYYEKRKLWEAKGDVVIIKHDGTRVYTQQLFWNLVTKRIYSNVDTKLVTETDELIGEGFESDEEMNEPRFRRWKGRMQVDPEQLQKEQQEGGEETTSSDKREATSEDDKPQPKTKPESEPEVKPIAKPEIKPAVQPEAKPIAKPEARPIAKPEARPIVKPEARPIAKPEVKPEVKPEATPEVKTEVKPEAKPVAKPAAEPAPAQPRVVGTASSSETPSVSSSNTTE